MKLKALLRKMIYRHRASSEDYIKWLCGQGMRIGEGTKIYDPLMTVIDETRPWMVSIGKNCNITAGVTILTHDYGWSVLKGYYGEVIGSAGKVEIGDNVFIGMHTTILAGVKIGSNVIVGANSLVNRDIPDNVVAVGNPCRIVKTLDEYRSKRKSLEVQEAVQMVRAYRDVYQKYPPVEIMREHFWLFENDWKSVAEFDAVMNLVSGSRQLSEQCFREKQKPFASYEDFLKYCFQEDDGEKVRRFE